MPEVLALLIILAGSGSIGWLILIQFVSADQCFDGDLIDLILSSLVLGICVLGWCAVVLAVVGGFSIGLLSAIGLLIGVALILIARKRGTWQSAWQDTIRSALDRAKTKMRQLPDGIEYVFLIAWLIAATWLFFRPHEFIVGGADAGVYVSVGANVARSGSLLIDDPVLRDLTPASQSVLLRSLPPTEAAPYYIFPGFYVPATPPGQIVPQFYPLHPVWQAVAYSLSGLRAELLMTGLWALLGGLSVYVVVRRLGGWPLAALALSGLTLSAMQVWFARYPTTEMLSQYLIWTGLWAFAAWITNRSPVKLWGLVAGLAWGAVFLTRIDTYFLLAVPIFAWLWRSATRQQRRADLWFYVPLLVLAGHSILHGLLWSRPYFLDTFALSVNLLNRGGLLVASIASLIVVGVFGIMWLRKGAIIVAWLQRHQLLLRWVAIGAVLLLAGYGWFVRPYVEAPPAPSADWYGGGIVSSYDQENLLRLGWYLSPLGIALAVAGVCLLIRMIDLERAALVGVGLFFTLLYMWRIQANPHQIYAMRRYVPVVLPFFIVAATFALGWLLHKRSAGWRGVGLLLSAAWLIGLGWSARGFVGQIDYDGLIAQMDQLNAQLAPGAVLLFNDQSPVGQGDFLGTPLRFSYGHDVFSVRTAQAFNRSQLMDTIRRWQAAGRTVYWIDVSTSQGAADLQLAMRPVAKTVISERVLEHAYDHKPTQVTDDQVGLQVFEILPEM